MMIADAVTRHGTTAVERLEADGHWCPMAHCNRRDDSFQDLPPLREPRMLQPLNDPRVSPVGFIHLGSFTGERMAVCTYASPAHPALAAYDYRDGSTLWLSPLEDLPGVPRRIPSGVLIARLARRGRPPERHVFAANPAEFVAYTEDGARVWKRSSRDIAAEAPDGTGIPISISFTDSRELVAATSKGWVVKLDPADGRTIDAYRLRTVAEVDGRLHRGTLVTMKSPIVIGDVMYLLAEFRPDPETPLPWVARPVYVVRIELNQRGVRGYEHAIKPIGRPARPGDRCPDRVFVGVTQGRGSPPAMVTPDGRVLIFAHAHRLVNGRLWPVIAGVEDDRGVLRRRWIATLNTARGDSVHSAPALHAESGTLFVATSRRLFVFRGVDALLGSVPGPPPLALENMVSLSPAQSGEMVFRSPFALTYDSQAAEIVVYTNFRTVPRPGSPPYGFVGAFSFPLGKSRSPRPLWSRPLAVSRNGMPAPGFGSVGQPALFRYDDGRRPATGLIVNTVHTGTYIIK